jgi:hypothetical protein
MSDFFSKMRSRRTVLVRTRKRPDLPETLLYVGGSGGDGKRTVLDPAGKEQRLAEAVLQSHYRLATGSDAEKLIADQWPKEVTAPQAPVRNK